MNRLKQSQEYTLNKGKRYISQTYVNEEKVIRSNVNKMRGVCGSEANVMREDCTTMTEALDTQLKHIEEKNQIIFQNEKSRRKRALLNIVGNIGYDLFGIMDSRFEEQQGKDMTALKNNEQFLLHIAKNHTSIMEATTNVIRNDENDIRDNAFHIGRLEGEIKRMKNRQEAQEQLYTIHLLVSNEVTQYETKQKTLMDALLNAHNKQVNTDIITPTQLRQQLGEIRNKIPEFLRLPEDDTQNAKK